MFQRFKEQIPAIVVIIAAMGGLGAWLYNRTVAQEQAMIEPLREENESLRAQAEENRRQIAATSDFLRQAVNQREGEVFKTDQEIQRMNSQRIDQLAQAISEKIVLPGPKTPEELARLEQEQADRISSQVAVRIRPDLADIAQSQRRAADEVAAGDRDHRQIQSLNDRLQAATSAAQDALKLSHEITALYLESSNDQGVLVRVLALPANLLRDTAGGNLINSRDRDRIQKQLDEQMRQLDQRLEAVQAQGAMAAAQ